jgi:hypothetical protein
VTGSGTPSGPGTAGALRRVIRRRPGRPAASADRCEMCSAALPERHRHVLDEQRDEVLCVCQACTLLFQRAAAGRGHYRLVPDQRIPLPELSPHDLGVPVGLAFFVTRPDGSTIARYPSPMGPTQWEIAAEAWQAMRERCPALQDLAPLVQALLVNTARGAREQWIVPIDDCYRLVALVRREWQGLSGGGRVWPAIEQFFADLDRRPGSPLRAPIGGGNRNG